MVTPASIRKLALSLPDVEESSHFTVSDFRVGKKIFATIHPGGKAGILAHIDPDKRNALVESDPDTFSLAGGGRALKIDFTRIAKSAYASLLIEAWCNTAPKRTVAAYRAR